jgi:hypothetical protein
VRLLAIVSLLAFATHSAFAGEHEVFGAERVRRDSAEFIELLKRSRLKTAEEYGISPEDHTRCRAAIDDFLRRGVEAYMPVAAYQSAAEIPEGRIGRCEAKPLLTYVWLEGSDDPNAWPPETRYTIEQERFAGRNIEVYALRSEGKELTGIRAIGLCDVRDDRPRAPKCQEDVLIRVFDEECTETYEETSLGYANAEDRSRSFGTELFVPFREMLLARFRASAVVREEGLLGFGFALISTPPLKSPRGLGCAMLPKE